MGESDFSAVVLVSASGEGEKAVRAAAERVGARTLRFESGEEALEMAVWATESFAAFVDTRLPGWEEIARRLRSLGVDAFPFTPRLSKEYLDSTLEFSLGSPTLLPGGPVEGREWVFVRALFASIHDPVCFRDLEGRAILYNEAFEELVRTVFRTEARPGIRTTELMPEDRKAYWEEVLRQAALGLPHREEFEWVLPDGRTRFYDLQLLPVRRSGRVFGTVEVTRDVSEHRRLNHILGLAQDIGRIGSWEYDISSRRTWWSPMMYTLFDLEPVSEAPSLDRIRSLFAPEDARALGDLYRRALSEGMPYVYECPIHTPSGERWIRTKCSPVSGEDGRPRLLRGVVQDIDEAMRNQRALEESEARARSLADRYTAVVESSRDGYLLISPEGRILESNRAYREMSGYWPDELAERSIGDLEEPDGQADRVLERGETGIRTARFEIRHRRKDGTTFDVEVTETRFEESGIRLAFFRDIAARKARERRDQATSELLAVLSSASDNPGYLDAVADLLRRGAGCDAVGIRLEKDGDFPLAASSGMDPESLGRLSSICARDKDGRRIPDSRGGFVLNCYCGAAIQGRSLPGLRGYGPSGTLWIEDAGSRLRRKALFRGSGPREFHCLGEGYQSFVIVPLKQGRQTLGILQFLARKAGTFHSSDIPVFESWAARIAGVRAEREASETLAHSEERFRRSLEAAPLPVLIHTEEGRIEALNDAWSAQSGMSRDLEGTLISVWLKNSGTPGLEDHLRSVFGTEGIRTGRFEFRRPTGEVRLWDLASRQVGRLRSGIRAAVTVANDVTEQMDREARERERQRQLLESEKLASLGTLVAGVAHEINNPNHVIMLNAQVLADVWNSLIPVLDETLTGQEDALIGGMEYRELRSSMPGIIGGIRSASSNIEAIVRELREFSAPDVDTGDEEVDLSQVAVAAANLLGGLIRGSTDRFRLETASALPMVRGGFVRLEQVVINLIMNACQALASRDRAVVVTTGLREDGRTVFLEVRDEGCGMDAAALAHVKDPFYTSKRGKGGLGLGVPLSNSIVEAYGGRLHFVSAPGKGTTATIELPRVG